MKDIDTDLKRAARMGSPKDNLPIVPIIIVALVAVAVLWLGPSLLGGNPPATSANATNMTADQRLHAPGALVLLSGAGRLANLPDSYQILFLENVDGIDNNITLAQEGGAREGIVSTAYHSRRYVWANGTAVVCEKVLDRPEVCSELNDNSTAGSYAIRLNATFPAKPSPDQQALDSWMVGIGAIRFVGNPQNKTVAGRACDDVEYTFDFSTLSSEDLTRIDPSMFVFKNYQLEKCIDHENGIPLYSRLQYDYQGIVQTYERTYQAYDSPARIQIDALAPNANWTQVDSAFDEDSAVLQSMGECTAQNTSQDRQSCVLSAAINLGEYGLCAFASDPRLRDECIYKLAAVKGQPMMCAKAGTYMDECYAYEAYSWQDVSYCSGITNQTDRDTCVRAAAGIGNASTAPDLNSGGQIVVVGAPGAGRTAGTATGTEGNGSLEVPTPGTGANGSENPAGAGTGTPNATASPP